MTKVKPEYERAETFPTTCYVYRGILYVPHYKTADSYVGPGFGNRHLNAYSRDFLLRVGAIETTEMLWSRAKDHVVQH